jgi:gamma-glutamyltranspeptidase/glutathione hydrolase
MRWISKRGLRRAPLVVVALLAWGAPAVSGLDAFVAEGRQGMVASDSSEASQAGCEVLRAGGNAVDAAIATSLALSVTRPFSMGLGGGGFMMVRIGRTGEVFVIDSRERAPGAATADMFVKARARTPNGPPPSQYGGLAAGVPGLLAGHQAMLARLGTRPLRDLLAPARRLAEQGFPIDESYVSAAKQTREDIRKHPALIEPTRPLVQGFLFGGAELQPGMVLRQPELAGTLARLAEQGIDDFYRGQIAEGIVRSVRAAGGIMTLADLAGYRPTWREPIRVSYRKRFEVLLMPPPSSGGIAIAEMLNILEHWDLAAVRERDPGLAAHLTVEAMKHAMADRARYLGDTDFATVPVRELLDKRHGDALAARIDERKVSPPPRYGRIPGDDSGTSHYCVADRWGNVVSATETVNTSWGCLVTAEPWGFVLNNEMDDFSAEPDRPNAYNLRQSDANAVAAGKRPLSSMSPTIVLENGNPVLAVGASGGPRIITATLQVLLNVIEYGMEPGRAVGQPRLHHQWQPPDLSVNDYPAGDPVVQGLLERGHVLSDARRIAIVQAIRIMGDRLIGASDRRKGGRPAGF